MSTINYLTVRNTILPVVRAVAANYSTLTGSTIVTSTITGSGISVSSISTNAITVSTITSNGITISNLNSNRALTLNTNKVVTHSVTTDTELGYLSGVTGPIQTQLGNYLPLSGGTLTGNLILNAGNVGISTTNPTAGLHIKNSTSAMRITGTLTNSSTRPSLTTVPASFEIRGSSSQGDGADDGFLRLSAGGGTATATQSYIDLSGYSSQHEEMNKNIRFGTSGVERMRITSAGNVGIGTATPGATLHVNGTSKLGGIGTPFKSVVAFIATLGAGGTGVVQFTITFPSAYTDVTKLIINVTMFSDYAASDSFSCTIRSIATTSFVLNVVRTDVASSWGLSLRANIVIHELT